MPCVNKNVTEAAACVRAAEDQVNPDSAAGVSSPSAADKQSITRNVAGARGHPRAAS